MARRLRWGTALVLGAALILTVMLVEHRIWSAPADDLSGIKADAILVLAYRDDRQVAGRALAAAGHSDTLVVSRSRQVRELQATGELPNDAGESDSPWFEQCDMNYPEYRTYCIVPQPNTTVGEAKEFSALASANGWDSVIVVTEPSHIGRSRMIFDRCFPGTVYMAASDPESSWIRNLYRSAYEPAAYVLDWIRGGGCR